MTMEVTMPVLERITSTANPHLKVIREALDAEFGEDAKDAFDVAIGYALGILLNRTTERANTLDTINSMIAPLRCHITEDAA
jgi:hypothetical protein